MAKTLPTIDLNYDADGVLRDDDGYTAEFIVVEKSHKCDYHGCKYTLQPDDDAVEFDDGQIICEDHVVTFDPYGDGYAD